MRGKLATQRIRDRAKADAKKSEKMPADAVASHASVDLTIDTDDEISEPENIEPESVENEESELEKSDEICDTQSTGENDAEYTDIDAPEGVKKRGRPPGQRNRGRGRRSAFTAGQVKRIYFFMKK